MLFLCEYFKVHSVVIVDNEESLELRKYQLEIAKPALDGKNCMIVAPRGYTATTMKINAQH